MKNNRIVVTGACGTIGAELISQLLADPVHTPEEVIGLDNNESQLFFMEQRYLDDPRVRFYVADIRDRDELLRKMKGVDIVFHTAALKHVILSERSPEQVVQTNIQGVQNVIAASTERGVKRVVFTSSDKAVNPTNVMGTSKLMGERLITAANSHKRGNGPIFTSTRFGNVLGSNGSVVPVFRDQIAKGGPVTVTDPEMTRFVMSVSQAVRLVIDSVALAYGGEVFITKMPVVRIVDLAKAMIEDLAPQYGFDPEQVEIRFIGAKAGEKLYEELMSQEEIRRAIELKDYFAVLPAFRGVYHDIAYDYSDILNGVVSKPYVSAEESFMSIPDIKVFLRENHLLDAPVLPDVIHSSTKKEFRQ
ncbi:polysaccharide biosynthesis protein [Methylomonas sp. SURF-2]|uniref:Polysaccharide biosynthesis protein n=1 Tax=Methylomonas subterranea TaxID=2952225 RepID=A0ABT1TCE0_9GAMM|nr:SDR family NAD(P)-dependent oxidoreductase [Methylomonas sp. SURF-2]MCQ8103080.1 polysaccharide biosynthesis protein [Methylomonas sp. SURF-2]